jgi:predicted kinase
MKKGRVYLMHGFIGSGKTTVSKELGTENDSWRFTPDEWMSELFGEDPPTESFNLKLTTLLKLVEPLWEKMVMSGVNVVLDFGFWTKSERLIISERLDKLGVCFEWINVNTPIEECRRRNNIRNSNEKRPLNITEDTFNLLLKRFEPITNDEKIGFVRSIYK